jgi:hypothetical protein
MVPLPNIIFTFLEVMTKKILLVINKVTSIMTLTFVMHVESYQVIDKIRVLA